MYKHTTGYIYNFVQLHFDNHRSAEARTHGSLGYVYELLMDTDKAIDHYEQVKRNENKAQQTQSL